jgi:hypothetical protein
MSEPPLSDDLRALETGLKGLTPAATLNRDRLLFEAGRASRRPGLAWPLAAGAASLTAVVFAALLLIRPEQQATERIVYIPVPTPVEPTAAAPAEMPPPSVESGASALERYQRVQEQVLRWELDGLPSVAPERKATPPSSMELLRSLQ